MKFIETVKKMLPGCAIALVIAVVAKFLEQLEESVGLHLIGASVIAMFIGMIVNRFYAPNDKTKPGIKFTSKKILKFAIILLGASLNITTVLTVGKFSLTVMLFTLATCFGLGYVIGKALGLDWKTSSLINAGTGICGGSADVTLDSGGKLLTLQRTLTELAPVLKVYKRPSQRAAFLESLLAVMEELQAYAVSPEQLSESVAQIEGESGDKLRDLSLIYGIYLSKLHAPGHDARDVLEKLEENLEASGYIDNKDIFLDGFSYFTGRELRILRILLRRAKSVTVTLLGDTQDRELFSESLRVRERLGAPARGGRGR